MSQIRNRRNTASSTEGVLCHIGYEPVNVSTTLLDDFSIRKRKITLGREKHSYLKEELLDKRVYFDMMRGYDAFNPKYRDSGLGLLQKYILSRRDDLKTITDDAHMVCRRSDLRKMMQSPRARGDYGWQFYVQKLDGVLFLYNAAPFENEFESLTDWNQRTTYAGFQFDSLVFAHETDQDEVLYPVKSVSPQKSTAMYGVFSTVFEKTVQEKQLKVFYTAEIDGLDSEGHPVEAKMLEHDLADDWGFLTRITGPFGDDHFLKQMHNGRYHFCSRVEDWWLQCRLTSVEDLVVGVKNRNCVVKALKKVNVEQLRAKYCPDFERRVFQALHGLLNRIRDKFEDLLKDEDDKLLVIERKPGQDQVRFSVGPPQKDLVLTQLFIRSYGNIVKEKNARDFYENNNGDWAAAIAKKTFKK